MRQLYAPVLVISIFLSFSSSAQTTFNYGLWQESGTPLDIDSLQIQGQVFNYKWSEIEPHPGVFDAAQFIHQDSNNTHNYSKPVIFQVRAKEDAPLWLYTNKGVPRVYEFGDTALTDTTGWSPFYADTTYQFYFNRMTDWVANYIRDSLSFLQRKWFVGILGSYGNPGDYLSYRGYVQPQYNLSDSAFFALWQKFSLHTYQAYDTNTITNQIELISNPSNDNKAHTEWVDSACPHGWLKMPTLGKIYQKMTSWIMLPGLWIF